ncbi:MAG: type VI secretion system ATPase TssH, partial [Gammaproteobacteria bacterium]
MRTDRLTSKFQLAIADAQSLAVGRDHQFVEPIHLMMALLEQDASTVRGLLTKAGVNMAQLRSQLGDALDRQPTVEGGEPGEIHLSNRLSKLLNVTDKLAQDRGDAF